MLCTYKPVKYMKDPGTGQPYYEFPVLYNGEDIIIDSDKYPVLDVLNEYLNQDGFTVKFMREFMDANRALFAKAYSATQLSKLTANIIGEADENMGTMWKCMPFKVVFLGGKFTIYWRCNALDVPSIDLGNIGDASRPQSPAEMPSAPEVVNVPEVAILEDVTGRIDTDLSGGIDISFRSPSDIKRERERRKVYEARFRAKLAVLRAESVVQKYVDRYGEDLSDDEETEAESDSDAYSEFSR